MENLASRKNVLPSNMCLEISTDSPQSNILSSKRCQAFKPFYLSHELVCSLLSLSNHALVIKNTHLLSMELTLVTSPDHLIWFGINSVLSYPFSICGKRNIQTSNLSTLIFTILYITAYNWLHRKVLSYRTIALCWVLFTTHASHLYIY